MAALGLLPVKATEHQRLGLIALRKAGAFVVPDLARRGEPASQRPFGPLNRQLDWTATVAVIMAHSTLIHGRFL